MNFLSPTHMIVILIIALLLFGSRLPEVARSIGKAINEFKRGMKDVSDDVSDQVAETPRKRTETPRLSSDEPMPRSEERQRETEKASVSDDV